MSANPNNLLAVQPLLNQKQDNARALIMVLAVMAFLATLALLFALSTERLKQSWQSQLQQTATVQLMLDTEATRESKIEIALSALSQALPDASLSQIGEAESQALVKPWLGDVSLPDDLPLPTLISIRLDNGNTLDIPALQALLISEGIIAEIDDHSRWSHQLGRTGKSIKTVASAILILILLAAISVSTFATQAALSAQHDVIRVLVQVGANDNFIARLFVAQSGRRGFYSGLIGALAGLLMVLLFFLSRQDQSTLLPDLSLAWTDGFWLLLFILCFTMFCAVATGLTAMHRLRIERRRR